MELGLGAHQALAEPGPGRVLAAYGRAAYLQVPGGLFALTTLAVPPGPIHARTASTVGRLRVGDRVAVTPAVLEAGPLLIDLRAARVWRGPLPTPAELAAATPLALGLLGDVPPSSLPIPPPEDLVGAGDLVGLAAGLGGLGPGLTPAGDDCLAGILLVARIRWGPPAEERLVLAATAVDTTDVSRAFLFWAARGQSIEPVHRFLTCATSQDALGASRALASLTRFGHSSGADLALGLRLALHLLPEAAHRESLPLP
jgi:hypothetical protein